MVAYSFQPQFREPILEKVKRHTIRAEGKRRHAREGETLQLYTGMRTVHCRLIGLATCMGVTRIRLDFEHGRVESLDTGRAWTQIDELDAFAQADGFPDGWRKGLVPFWHKAHGPDLRQWDGFRISWGETLRPGPAGA